MASTTDALHKPLTVLVTDGHLRSSLAVVRSLGSAGYRVIITSPYRRCLAGASRYAVAEVLSVDPISLPNEYSDDIGRMLDRWNIDILLPMSEESLLALLPYRDRFSATLIPFPDLATFQRACDKSAVLSLAADLGLTVPRQIELRSKVDAIDFTAESFFPVVVKSSRSVSGDGRGRGKYPVHYADDAAGLALWLAELPEAAFPVLVQQRIVGPGFGAFFLIWGDRVIASFAHKRLREKPPTGGVSVIAESVSVDQVPCAAALRLLRALGWTGVAMVEFKKDAESGIPYLMEINGRFWGSLQLAIDAGVDFPRLLVESARGQPIGEPPTPALGVRTRWWWGDVDHLVARLRERGPTIATLRTAIKSFVEGGRGARNEVFRVDDWKPAWHESINWMRRR